MGINQSFRETLDRNGNGHTNTPVRVQSQSAFIPTRRSGYYGIVDTPATNRRPVAQPTNGGLIENASNRVRPNNRSVTQPRLFTQLTSSSITTSTSNVVNTSSRGQVSVNIVPAHQSNQIISQSLVYPPNMDISSEFRNLNLTTSQHNQSTPPMTAESGNQNSSQAREPSQHNSQSRGESNMMSSTMIVPPNRNSEDSESDSDDPDVGNIFENSEGQVDYKTAMVYWMTKCKEKAKQKDKSTTKTSHKINYGRVHPPTLQLESELRSCTFMIWKKQWLGFCEKSNMYESEGLAFLKEFSVPDPHYKQLISLCETVNAVFELLGTQFSDKGTDYRILVKYICGLPALKENYDFQHQQNVIKKILKYLTLYNRVFSPEKDLDQGELEGSMLSWIPKSQTQISMRKFIKEIKEGKDLKGTPFSKTYHDILTKELNIITNLQANEERKKDMYGVTGFQTLNIVEAPREQEISQDESQDEINVHYGTNNNPKK